MPISGKPQDPLPSTQFSTHSGAKEIGKAPTPSSSSESRKKLPSVLSKARVALEVCAPISSRGILVLVIAAPIYLAISLGKGISEMISKRSISSFGKGFIKGAGGLKKQAHGGISDSYTDLTSAKNAEKGAKIAKDNIHYARSADGDGKNISKISEIDSENNRYEGIKKFLIEIENLGFKSDTSNYFYDPKTGSAFMLTIDEFNGEIMLCFVGLGVESRLKEADSTTKNKILENSLKQTASDALGYPSKASIQAIKLGKALKKCTDTTGDTPVAVGSSHGGSLAQCAAVANGIKGVVFNSQPMGAGTRRFIGQKKIAKNSKHITAFSGKGDILSGTKAMNVIAVLFERVTGLPVPRTVGKGYNLPKGVGVKSAKESHVEFTKQLEALMK